MARKITCGELSIDKMSPEPLHLQLRSELLSLLRRTDCSPGDQLPSERQLVDYFGIHRTTVHRAYAELLHQNLAERAPDKSLRIVPGLLQKLRPVFPTLGLVLPMCFSEFIELNDRGALLYLKGIIDRATMLGCSTTMLPLPALDTPPELIHKFIRLKCEPMSGLIHFGSRSIYPDPPLEAVLREAKIPQICISGRTQFPNVGSVVADIRQGIRELCAEMRKRQIRKVGIVDYFDSINDSGSGAKLFVYSARLQEQEVIAVLREEGFECREEWQLFHCRDAAVLAGQLYEMMEKAEHPELLWCSNCDTLRLAFDACRIARINVPGNLALVGSNPDAAIPGAAGIPHPFREIGERAVDWLFNYGANPHPNHIRIASVFHKGSTF